MLHLVKDHLADVGKMVKAGVALSQTYFAVKTRQQELIENFGVKIFKAKKKPIKRSSKSEK